MSVTFMGRGTKRGLIEKQLVEKYFPGFVFSDRGENSYVSGWVVPNGSTTYYALLVEIPPGFPHQKPRLFVTSPVTLWTYGARGRINDMEFSHSFHTLSTDYGGCCQICHVALWDASISLVKVLLMGALWCEAYTMHRACGDDIDTCLKRLKQRAKKG